MKQSAGLLMFRRTAGELEVLLVHPGGPFWRNKELGAWTIPKGEPNPDEDLFERAKIEFEEELGIPPRIADAIELGSVKQKGGKLVHAWAFEGYLPADFVLRSNTFELKGGAESATPATGPRSFPEVDRAEFFSIEEAREKINSAQIAFLDRLCALVLQP